MSFPVGVVLGDTILFVCGFGHGHLLGVGARECRKCVLVYVLVSLRDFACATSFEECVCVSFGVTDIGSAMDMSWFWLPDSVLAPSQPWTDEQIVAWCWDYWCLSERRSSASQARSQAGALTDEQIAVCFGSVMGMCWFWQSVSPCVLACDVACTAPTDKFAFSSRLLCLVCGCGDVLWMDWFVCLST